MLRHPNLVAWYPFENDANDCSGNGRNGVLNGVTFIDGFFGKRVNFVNGTDHITVPNIPMSQEMSFCFWISRLESNTRAIIQKRTSSYNGFFIFLYNGDIMVDIGGYANRWATGVQIPLDTNTHITITYNINGLKLYKNGLLVASTILGDHTLDVEKVATIGNGGGSVENQYPLHGTLDDIQIYNKALSEPDIKRIMMGLHPLN